MQVPVKRKNIIFQADASRVITRFLYTNDERALNTIRSVLRMRESEANVTLNQVFRDYSRRHRNSSRIFEKHFNMISHLLPKLNIDAESLSYSQKILIGAYFTLEYSIEAAAFFNPSIVEHPDQSETGHDEKRVIISFRATGEGHISSIVFRTGLLDKNNNLIVEPVGSFLEEADIIRRHVYDKASFKSKLDEMDFHNIVPYDLIMDKLDDKFTYGELRKCIEEARKTLHLASDKKILFDQLMWVASAHYELQFSLDTNISERVVFPVSINERNGIEDARFVKFSDEDNSVKYYATYTAYDGSSILPKMLDTTDFYHFRILPVHGEIAQNKGMALFPRKINGKYAMLCRLDGFNNYISFSDNITVWQRPDYYKNLNFPGK